MITSDRRPPRTKNTTIIVAATAFNARRTRNGLTFTVASPNRNGESQEPALCRRACRGAHVCGKAPICKIAEPEGPAGGPGGALGRSGLVAVRPAGAGPDEGEAVAVLVVEEVGVNRRVERRIVQLDRQVVAALVGALRPGGPDLRPADEDPVAGGVVVGRLASGTMRTFLVCTLRVTISPWNSLPTS